LEEVLETYICKNSEKKCDINPDDRTCCKYCRLKKCLDIPMKAGTWINLIFLKQICFKSYFFKLRKANSSAPNSIQMSILCPKFIWNSLWLANMRSLQSEFQLVTSFFHKINAFFFRVFSKDIEKRKIWFASIMVNVSQKIAVHVGFKWW